ncbi:hypothetical protein B0H15DRAFT_934479 [Mycena belliarum]|uniref:C3H1-type domain-containing protein n=1 Tax=Mycena belliarum TaxID=1033014 RepID=A0AAD6TVC8_9AGAR|nr:hypothetical protein B0H15DRAFT_934479 [Mycena belliae]
MSGNGDESTAAPTPPGLEGQPEVAKKCADIVQQFRDGKVSKAVASTKIMQAVPTAFVEGSSGERGAQAYLEILDIVEKELAAAAERGRGRGGQEGIGPRSRSPSPPHGGYDGSDRRGDSRSPSPNEGDEFGGVPPRSPPPYDRRGRAGHRGRSRSPWDGDVRGSGSKRQRVDDSLLPWVVEDFIVERQLSAELQRTRLLLMEFRKDPKYVLGSILDSTRHISFPESEWTAIIKGQSIDLNKVISHQFSILHDRRQSESLGDGVQLVFGSSAPTKAITTQSDWITAWARATEALLLVFPHRRRELDAYRQYITDLFASSGEHVHERVILLDRKLRNEVSGRRDLELSDFAQFGHWERSFLSDHGAGLLESKPKAKGLSGRGAGGSSVAGGGSGSRKSLEPCKRFNEERCPTSKAQCRYTHICSRCRRGHPVAKCDRPSAVPE